MLDGEPRDLELTSGDQLRALTDGFRLRLLTAIGRRPGSAKQLAARFDVPTTRLYHHLGILEEQGFIRTVATRRSGARTERCYGLSWRNIVPGPDLATGEPQAIADMMEGIAAVTGTQLREAVLTGALDVERHADGDVGQHVVSWSTMRLTEQQRRGFAREFADLIKRMTAAARDNAEADPSSDASAVAVMVVMAPDVTAPD